MQLSESCHLGSNPSPAAEFKFFASEAFLYKKAEIHVAVSRLEAQDVNLSDIGNR